jgi:hypothetical protein
MNKLILAMCMITPFNVFAENAPIDRVGEVIIYDGTRSHSGADPDDEMSDEWRAKLDSLKGLQLVDVRTATITDIKDDVVTFTVESKHNDMPGSEVQTFNEKQQINCKTHKIRTWFDNGWDDWGTYKSSLAAAPKYFESKMCTKAAAR